MRGALILAFVAACGEPSPAKSAAPVALDVRPLPSSSVTVLLPPPDSAKSVDPAPARSDAPTGDPGSGMFDKGAAAAALAGANIQACAPPGGMGGGPIPGHVTVTFEPSGVVSSATVDSPPYAGTPVGGCVAQEFATIRIAPFQGGPVRVGKSFALP